MLFINGIEGGEIMEYHNVYQTVTEIIIKIMGDIKITKDSHLINDLELSSLDAFEVLDEIETNFSIHIPEKLILQMVTVDDICNAVLNIIEQKQQ